MYITHKDKVTNYPMLAANQAVTPQLKIHACKKAVMQNLIDQLTREFNRIRGLQFGLCAVRRSDAHAYLVDTDISELKAECCIAPHNKKQTWNVILTSLTMPMQTEM